MKWCWLLIVFPHLAGARIVQIGDWVKRGDIPPGTVIHETVSFVFEPGLRSPGERLVERPAYRYRFGGIVQEGSSRYLRLEVQNCHLEKVAASNRARLLHSKGGSLPQDQRTVSAVFHLLVPLEAGRAQFPFPPRAIPSDPSHQLEVLEAVLEVRNHRLMVRQVTRTNRPAASLTWVPPRDWPLYSETVYCEPASR